MTVYNLLLGSGARVLVPAGGGNLEVNGSTVTNFSNVDEEYNLTSPGTYTVIPRNGNVTVDCFLWGAGGAGTVREAGLYGGGGGYTKGLITLVQNRTYVVVVGGPGALSTSLGAGGTPGGGGTGDATGSGSIFDGGGGGGYSGLFAQSVLQGNALLISGGGGGGSGDPATGGGGGGSTGGGGASARNGGGASQTAGGLGGTTAPAGQNGSALLGGNGGSSGAGGGGGYFGGGGGSNSGPGHGGGGSGFIGGPGITNGSTTAATTTGANPDGNKPDGFANGGSSTTPAQSGYFRFRRALLATPTDLPPVAGYIAWYTGSSWTGTQWTDLSGNGYNVTSISGTVTYTSSAIGNNSTKIFSVLQGTTGTVLTWPAGILPATYTLFHVTRYTGGTRRRIFTGTNINWLSGFWSGLSGQAFHNGWLTNNVTDFYGNNWVLSTDQNSFYRGYSGGSSNTGTGGGSSAGLSINSSASVRNETSDWQCAEVIVYASTLSAGDQTLVENYLKAKYGL